MHDYSCLQQGGMGPRATKLGSTMISTLRGRSFIKTKKKRTVTKVVIIFIIKRLEFFKIKKMIEPQRKL